MPVMSKPRHARYELELRTRFENLMTQIAARELASPSEGVGKGEWGMPERMCATVGLSMDLRLAVEDFKAILAEVKSLK